MSIVNVLMPQLGETVADGIVLRWLKHAGEAVKADEALFEVETEKVSMEIPSPATGILKEILVPVGNTVLVGTRLAVIESTGSDIARLSPVVRRLMAEHNLDARDIRGTGENGRITRADVLAHITRGNAAAADQHASASSELVETIAFGPVRRRIAEHMVRSKATSPHVLQAVEVDFEGVHKARQSIGVEWQRTEGFALTYLPFVARAVCIAIADFPQINATIAGAALQVHARINLAIAVDLSFNGLVAPIVRDAGGMSLSQLACAINALAHRARRGALDPDDLLGGTYSISNAGSFGTYFTAPIINQPQVAILSTDGVKKRPVVIQSDGMDEIAVRHVGILAHSFDHRAFDGAYSAAFLKRLREIVEQSDWHSILRNSKSLTT